jgi:hypothetical protein
LSTTRRPQTCTKWLPYERKKTLIEPHRLTDFFRKLDALQILRRALTCALIGLFACQSMKAETPLDFSGFIRQSASALPKGANFAAPDFRRITAQPVARATPVSLLLGLPRPGLGLPAASQETAGTATSPASKPQPGGSTAGTPKNKSKLPWILAIAAAGAAVGVAMAMKKSGDSSNNSGGSDGTPLVTVGPPMVGAP